MSSPTPETIGFIGLGLMGHGMAKNIVEKGYPLDRARAVATASRSRIWFSAAPTRF